MKRRSQCLDASVCLSSPVDARSDECRFVCHECTHHELQSKCVLFCVSVCERPPIFKTLVYFISAACLLASFLFCFSFVPILSLVSLTHFSSSHVHFFPWLHVCFRIHFVVVIYLAHFFFG